MKKTGYYVFILLLIVSFISTAEITFAFWPFGSNKEELQKSREQLEKDLELAEKQRLKAESQLQEQQQTLKQLQEQVQQQKELERQLGTLKQQLQTEMQQNEEYQQQIKELQGNITRLEQQLSLEQKQKTQYQQQIEQLPQGAFFAAVAVAVWAVFYCLQGRSCARNVTQTSGSEYATFNNTEHRISPAKGPNRGVCHAAAACP